MRYATGKEREELHQIFWDSPVNGIGASNLVNNTALFGAAQIGRTNLTNLKAAGQLPSDQIFAVVSLRSVMAFQSLADAAFPAYPTAASSNAQAEDLYTLLIYGSFLRFTVGAKPMLDAPVWNTPAGGGPAGFTTENNRHVITNGLATQEAILRLALPIGIGVRENFDVTLSIYPFAVLGSGYTAALDPLATLNAFDGIKFWQVALDGVYQRDIQ